jgi:hypothetical protein
MKISPSFLISQISPSSCRTHPYLSSISLSLFSLLICQSVRLRPGSWDQSSIELIY